MCDVEVGSVVSVTSTGTGPRALAGLYPDLTSMLAMRET